MNGCRGTYRTGRGTPTNARRRAPLADGRDHQAARSRDDRLRPATASGHTEEGRVLTVFRRHRLLVAAYAGLVLAATTPAVASGLTVTNVSPPDRTHIPTPADGYVNVTFNVDPNGCDPAVPVTGGSLYYGASPGQQAVTGAYAESGTGRFSAGLSSLLAIADAFTWHVEVTCRALSGAYVTGRSPDWTVFVGCVNAFTQVHGDVRVNGAPAGPGTQVNTGDVIETGAKSRAELKLIDLSVMRIGPKTTFRLFASECKKERRVSAKLVVGVIWAKLAHWVGGDAKFQVSTAGGGGGVRDSIFEVAYDRARRRMRVKAIEGDAYIFGTTGHVQVKIHPPFCRDVIGRAAPTRPFRCALPKLS